MYVFFVRRGGVEVKMEELIDFFWSTLLELKYASNLYASQFTHSSTDEWGMFTIWGKLFSYV